MKRDANLLFSVFAIDALYLVSFFLPVRPLGKDFPEGDNEFGWDVFVQVIQAILNFDDRSWTAFELFLPNLLLWMGIICLWGRVPVVSFVTGISATAIAAKSLHWWQLFPYPRPPENLPSFLNANLGAYLWLVSMLSLAVAGFIFTQEQWRQTRRLRMIGDR